MNKKEIQHKKNKKPWPTKKAMEQIYNKNLWGDNNSKFYSGFGSHNPELVEPYIRVVKEFLTSFKKTITVCDLGCGDFNIGRQLVEYTKNYIGIDIVENLISYNIENYKADNLKFQCLDIAKENIPQADCVILRQVLQHLSNKEVQSIIKKLGDFKFIILTEHIPNGDFLPNKDIISGQGIRLKQQSGIDISKYPFNFRVKTKQDLLSIKLHNSKGYISTWLFQVF